MHKPVLLSEALDDIVAIHPEWVLDLTLGGGGYTRYLLENSSNSKVMAFDVDAEAIERAKAEFKEEIAKGRLILVHQNYSEFTNELEARSIPKVDGIVADLGFSSFQMDTPERGFSFMRAGPLDMRLNQESELTAQEIVNSWPEHNLADILKRFGEERLAKKIASKITEARNESEITTTEQLAKIVESAVPAKLRKESSIHPATKTFQALRIQVNDELQHLSQVLEGIPERLNEGGIASIVSFHSLEDRLVKQKFQFLTEQCICVDRPMPCERCYKPPAIKVHRKLITPSEKEVSDNPRSRSAKLRIIKRTEYPILDPR